MYIEKLPSGHYRFAERYVDSLTGKTKRVSVTFEKNTRATQKQAAEILLKKIESANAIIEYSKMTVGEAAGLYLEFQEQAVKMSTYTRNSHAINTITNMLGRDTLLSALNAGYIKKAMLDSGREKGTLNEDLTRLKAFIRWAYKNDYISEISFLDKLEKFKVEKKAGELKYLEGEELRNLLPELKIDINRLFVEFLALSGLRSGEALALEWADIDMNNKLIHIDKTFDHVNQIVTSTKTESSTRDIFIQKELAATINKIRKYYYSYGIIPRYLFCDFDGNRLKYYALEKYFRENCERVLGVPYSLHSLRHTHASLLFEAGMSLDGVSDRLGHSDSKITKDIYIHITQKKKDQYNSQLMNVKIL